MGMGLCLKYHFTSRLSLSSSVKSYTQSSTTLDTVPVRNVSGTQREVMFTQDITENDRIFAILLFDLSSIYLSQYMSSLRSSIQGCAKMFIAFPWLFLYLVHRLCIIRAVVTWLIFSKVNQNLNTFNFYYM